MAKTTTMDGLCHCCFSLWCC